jgi:hypothetical protein
MALAGSSIRIITTPMDPTVWTLISGPSDMFTSKVTVRNQQAYDVYIRTDRDDPTTQDTIPANFERTFQFFRSSALGGLFWARSSQGTGPLVVVCNT